MGVQCRSSRQQLDTSNVSQFPIEFQMKSEWENFEFIRIWWEKYEPSARQLNGSGGISPNAHIYYVAGQISSLDLKYIYIYICM